MRSIRKLELKCEWRQCRANFELMDDFNDHLNTHISSDIGSVSVAEGGTYICQWRQCDFVTTNRHDLIRHLYFHGHHTKVKWLGHLKHCQLKAGPCRSQQNRNIVPKLPDEFKCCWENCCMVAIIPDKFYEHVGGHVDKAEPEMLPCGKMGFKCHWEGCNYEYSTDKIPAHIGRHKLKEHVICHTKERRYACPQCGCLFLNRTKLVNHFNRQIDVEDHNFGCDQCSRKYPSERLLKNHTRYHSVKQCPKPSALKNRNKPYACEFCEYRSKNPQQILEHMDGHGRDRSYPCQVDGCEYGARPIRNLHDHYGVKHWLTNQFKDKENNCNVLPKRITKRKASPEGERRSKRIAVVSGTFTDVSPMNNQDRGDMVSVSNDDIATSNYENVQEAENTQPNLEHLDMLEQSCTAKSTGKETDSICNGIPRLFQEANGQSIKEPESTRHILDDLGMQSTRNSKRKTKANTAVKSLLPIPRINETKKGEISPENRSQSQTILEENDNLKTQKQSQICHDSYTKLWENLEKNLKSIKESYWELYSKNIQQRETTALAHEDGVAGDISPENRSQTILEENDNLKTQKQSQICHDSYTKLWENLEKNLKSIKESYWELYSKNIQQRETTALAHEDGVVGMRIPPRSPPPKHQTEGEGGQQDELAATCLILVNTSPRYWQRK